MLYAPYEFGKTVQLRVDQEFRLIEIRPINVERALLNVKTLVWFCVDLKKNISSHKKRSMIKKAHPRIIKNGK